MVFKIIEETPEMSYLVIIVKNCKYNNKINYKNS